jgi:mannonate dehydratase
MALMIKPLDEDRMVIARQIGVTDIAAAYPGPERDDLRRLQQRIATAGLRLSVIEDDLPLDQVVLGRDGRDRQIDELSRFIDSMGKLGIDVLCYNFMTKLDMTRTRFDVVQRGGALTSGFDWAQARNWPPHEAAPTTDEQQWDRLEYFLKRVVPVAEGAGVKLAMHPDDPPIPQLCGMAHIMREPAAFDRLLEISDSPVNGLTFCQGCFSEMNGDICALIHRFGPRIHFVHVRDAVGGPTRFEETFHDNGPTDMVAAFEAYHDIGFDGPLRPDHVPLLHGEAGQADGYSFLGRLHAVGYLTGLMQAAEHRG